tara:strand:+ start:211 stop:357 length:147 start_codon:yes stop_codon:yes gene_type:complete
MLEFRRCVHRALTYKDSIIEVEKEIPDHRKLAIVSDIATLSSIADLVS